MAKLRVMLDTNVVLDVLAKRDPFYISSAKVWAAIENQQIEGFIAAHSITTIFYILSRQISKEKTLSTIGDILQIFSVSEVNQMTLMKALALGWNDFEDAVQICAAAQSNIDFFITRDKFIVSTDLFTIVTPEDFISLIKALKKP
jgi:predicted nucleic acid-binding protein